MYSVVGVVVAIVIIVVLVEVEIITVVVIVIVVATVAIVIILKRNKSSNWHHIGALKSFSWNRTEGFSLKNQRARTINLEKYSFFPEECILQKTKQKQNKIFLRKNVWNILYTVGAFL